jgi:hypothetical protein
MRKTLLLLAALSLPLPAYAQHAAAAGPTRATKSAQTAGFKDCAPAMDQVVRLVHEDDEEYGHVDIWAKERPNDRIASTVTSQTYKDGRGLTSFTGVKTASGKCDAVYAQAVLINDASCDELKKTVFKEWKLYTDLDDAPVYEDPSDPSINAILLSTGKKSCLIFKQAVFFGE